MILAEKPQALGLLRQSLGNSAAEFRPGQWEAIDAIVNRSERRLVVERTGWGKSSVYFIATKLLRESGKGLTLIVSPLLALMRNQIEAAESLGVNAQTINSSNSDNWSEILLSVQNDEVDALLISPERLANSGFVEKVLMPISQNIGLLVVDEAHCISDWGHDFRPDYRRLINILQSMPKTVSILGTTATANDRVIQDIQEQLGDVVVQRGSLMRDSLTLQTIEMPTQAARLAWIAENIGNIPGTGIIYTLTTRDAEQVADWLVSNGINAKAYHSGVTSDEFEDSDSYKIHLEDLLLKNEIKVLVATTALGMGYDKPDLGFVIHYQSPASIIAYYQQVGRAGRSIPVAYGFLLSGEEDDKINNFFRKSAFPKAEWVHSVLELLADHDGLTVSEIETCLNLRSGQIKKVLKFLSVETLSPVLKDGSRWMRTTNDYHIDTDKISKLTKQRLTEWDEIQAFIRHEGCQMQYLAAALDDPEPKPCGKCENCTGAEIVGCQIEHETGVRASQFLRHSEMDLKCGVQIPKGAFAEYEFSGNLHKNLRASMGKTLSRWGDAGWGETVRQNKNDGHFTEGLVEAVVEMINTRWNPEPAPTWVTCVPSINNPKLVPDFSQRVAASLGIPFYEVVTKVKNNDPQKFQENRFHQCKNLDGVFEISNIPESGPVLLIDDVIDSGLTMTVVSALLLRAGCDEVLPMALASSSVGG